MSAAYSPATAPTRWARSFPSSAISRRPVMCLQAGNCCAFGKHRPVLAAWDDLWRQRQDDICAAGPERQNHCRRRNRCLANRASARTTGQDRDNDRQLQPAFSAGRRPAGLQRPAVRRIDLSGGHQRDFSETDQISPRTRHISARSSPMPVGRRARPNAYGGWAVANGRRPCRSLRTRLCFRFSAPPMAATARPLSICPTLSAAPSPASAPMPMARRTAWANSSAPTALR